MRPAPAVHAEPAPAFADPTPGAVRFAEERSADRRAVDALIDSAFGPGRYAKTAERLREGNSPRLDLSVCAWSGDRLAGAVRQWPIRIGGEPAIFFGPIAVTPEFRRGGLGHALAARACERATAAGEPLVLLVGPQAFFAPLGFRPAGAGVLMPGPIDPARLLWRALRPGAVEHPEGLVRPAPDLA